MEIPARNLDWQLKAAKVEGLIPFIFEGFDEVVALRSIARTWAFFVRDYPFQEGILHVANLDQNEIMRSWYSEERRQFVSFLRRSRHPTIKRCADAILRAKDDKPVEANSEFLASLEAMDRLDRIRPILTPLITLQDWVKDLRGDRPEFLEIVDWEVEEKAFSYDPENARDIIDLNEAHRPGSHCWAAGLAAAMRSKLFGMSNAPFLIPGVTSKKLFRKTLPEPSDEILRENLKKSFELLYKDITAALPAYRIAEARLSDRRSTSRAFAAWRFAYGAGPLTRLELARALGVTHRAAYNLVDMLVSIDLMTVDQDKVVRAKAA